MLTASKYSLLFSQISLHCTIIDVHRSSKVQSIFRDTVVFCNGIVDIAFAIDVTEIQ